MIRRSFQLSLVTIIGLLINSCSSSRNSPALEVVSGDPKNPAVEAWIEYPGPDARWSGPSGFFVHVNLSASNEAAQITWTSEAQLFADSGRPVPREVAQEAIDSLADAMDAKPVPEPDTCSSMVRVRIVRVDQSIQEKKGCRSPIGWQRIASEVVSDLLTARTAD